LFEKEKGEFNKDQAWEALTPYFLYDCTVEIEDFGGPRKEGERSAKGLGTMIMGE